MSEQTNVSVLSAEEKEKIYNAIDDEFGVLDGSDDTATVSLIERIEGALYPVIEQLLTARVAEAERRAYQKVIDLINDRGGHKYIYGFCCGTCGGGGALGQDTCPDCDGDGIINWNYDALIEKLKELSQLKANDGNEQCLIFGSEVDFEMNVSIDKIKEVCNDIWNKPKNYAKFDDAYYDFLKFLWVRYPDGKEVRLADIVNSEAEQVSCEKGEK